MWIPTLPRAIPLSYHGSKKVNTNRIEQKSKGGVIRPRTSPHRTPKLSFDVRLNSYNHTTMVEFWSGARFLACVAPCKYFQIRWNLIHSCPKVDALHPRYQQHQTTATRICTLLRRHVHYCLPFVRFLFACLLA